MSKDTDLLLKKARSGSLVKSMITDFGFAVCNIDWPPLEVKDLASRDWPGENGEDVFFPSQLNVKPYEITIELSYKGALDTAANMYKLLCDYLVGADNTGAKLYIYDTFNKKGRQSVSLKSISHGDLCKSEIDEVLPATLILKVFDPLSDIVLTYVGNKG